MHCAVKRLRFDILAFLFAVVLLISLPAYFMITDPPNTHKFKYLALGDSYTIGESVADDERFPAQLVKRLSAEGFDIGDPLIIAKTGWTTDELAAAINEKNVKDTFDIVTLLIGVNNQYRGRSTEEYRGELKQLIETALRYAGGKKENVFIVSIPDWGVTPFAEGRDRKKIAEEIDLFNKVKKEESDNYGIRYYDITEISRDTDPGLVAADGLHPSAKMYKMWVDKIYNDIKEALK